MSAATEQQEVKAPAHQRLLDLVIGLETFVAQDGAGYVVAMRTIDGKQVRECLPVRSTEFLRYLNHRWFESEATTIDRRALDRVRDTFDAMAHGKGREDVHIRSTMHNGRIYIDLADKLGRAIEISEATIRVLDSSFVPVRFVRPKGMSPLPEPDLTGSVEDVERFIPPTLTRNQRILIKAAFVAAAYPSDSYYLIVLEGGEGSGKSTVLVLISTVDPIANSPGGLKRNEDDFMIEASKTRIFRMDNLSKPIQAWVSNLICRLTGGLGAGYRKKANYTDTDEVIITAFCSVIVSSIPRVVVKPDALDRAIRIIFPKWKGPRIGPKDMKKRLAAAQPKILGCLCRALQAALRADEGIDLPSEIRMVDQARIAIAAGEVLGYSPQEFMDAHVVNIRDIKRATIEDAPFGPALLAVLDERGPMTEPASTVLGWMRDKADEDDKVDQFWPKTGKDLTYALMHEYRASLRGSGWDVSTDRDAAQRMLTFERVEPE